MECRFHDVNAKSDLQHIYRERKNHFLPKAGQLIMSLGLCCIPWDCLIQNGDWLSGYGYIFCIVIALWKGNHGLAIRLFLRKQQPLHGKTCFPLNKREHLQNYN